MLLVPYGSTHKITRMMTTIMTVMVPYYFEKISAFSCCFLGRDCKLFVVFRCVHETFLEFYLLIIFVLLCFIACDIHNFFVSWFFNEISYYAGYQWCSGQPCKLTVPVIQMYKSKNKHLLLNFKIHPWIQRSTTGPKHTRDENTMSIGLRSTSSRI